MELLARIRATADADPSRIAYRDARTGRTLDYAALGDAIARHAADAIATQPIVFPAKNDIDTPAKILGPLAAGAEVLLAIPTSTPNELAELAERVAARGYRTGGALLLTTSGTTGTPQIVRRTAGALDAVAANMVEAIAFSGRDHVLATVPLAHSYGLEHGLLAPLWAGATVTLCNGLDLSAIVAALALGAVTVLPSVPAVLERLVDSSDAIVGISALRAFYSAGGRLPPSVRARCVERFGRVPGQVYGSTELGSVTYLADGIHAPAGNVGVSMRGVSVRIVRAAEDGAGEVAIRAASMFEGYDDGAPATLVDGHLLTGDLGRIEGDGSLTITGRSKLLIDTGGPKVDPLEVERAIESHPAVACCAVVALRQSDAVSRLRALVVLRPDAPTVTAEMIRAFALARLAPHKVPRVVEFRDALPRTAMGKIARAQLEQS